MIRTNVSLGSADVIHSINLKTTLIVTRLGRSVKQSERPLPYLTFTSPCLSRMSLASPPAAVLWVSTASRVIMNKMIL